MPNHELGRFPTFRDSIASLPDAESYSRDQLLVTSFALVADDRFESYYAPFDHQNAAARVMLVGVTPGWTQMESSYVEAHKAITEGEDDHGVLRRAKTVAAFSGALRTNLVAMLDGIGLPAALGIESSATLFSPEGADVVQSTSMLRYPVFHKGKNYSGSPAVSKSQILTHQLEPFIEELAVIKRALIVPLGKAVGTVLEDLSAAGHVASKRCLFGFPHPSGAYAGRAKQFAANREDLTRNLRRFFDS